MSKALELEKPSKVYGAVARLILWGLAFLWSLGLLWGGSGWRYGFKGLK